MQNKGKYYITTAIAYTSGKPHIGNTYEIILADCIARYKRADGYDVHFHISRREATSTDRRSSPGQRQPARLPRNSSMKWPERSRDFGIW